MRRHDHYPPDSHEAQQAIVTIENKRNQAQTQAIKIAANTLIDYIQRYGLPKIDFRDVAKNALSSGSKEALEYLVPRR